MRVNTPIKIYVHHTGISRSAQSHQFLPINRYHRREFGSYCLSSMGYYGGYTILIEPDGREYRYREDLEEGCHTKGKNVDSLGVALSGNFDIENPTDKQIVTLKKRLRKWTGKYNIAYELIDPHRAVAAKTCYGSMLPDEWAKNLLATADRETEVMKLKRRLDAIWLVVIELQKLLRKWKK